MGKQIDEATFEQLNGYSLSRNWFDYCFENPEKITPTHTAIYFFSIEHCNRLGWKKKFGFPTTMVMEAIGVKSYNTYTKHLFDLVKWGFIEMIEKSKNQYSSNIIALSNFDKAPNKALDKALIKHTSKQSESTQQSIDSIDKQETSKPKNKETIPTWLEFLNYAEEKCLELNYNLDEQKLKAKFMAWKEAGWKTGKDKKIKNWKSTLLNTLVYLRKEKQDDRINIGDLEAWSKL